MAGLVAITSLGGALAANTAVPRPPTHSGEWRADLADGPRNPALGDPPRSFPESAAPLALQSIYGGFSDDFGTIDDLLWSFTGPSGANWTQVNNSGRAAMKLASSACCAPAAFASTRAAVVEFNESFELEFVAVAPVGSPAFGVGFADDDSGGGYVSLIEIDRAATTARALNWSAAWSAGGFQAYRFVFQSGRVSVYLGGQLAARFANNTLAGAHRLALTVASPANATAEVHFDRVWLRHVSGTLAGPGAPPERWFTVRGAPGNLSIAKRTNLTLNLTLVEEATTDRIAYSNTSLGGNVLVTDLEGDDHARLTASSIPDWVQEYRSDGILLTTRRDSVPTTDVVNLSVDGSGEHVILDATTSNSHYGSPHFGPDGGLAYEYTNNGALAASNNIYLTQGDGTGTPTQVSTPGGKEVGFQGWFNQTHMWVSLQTGGYGAPDIFLWDARAGSGTQLTTGGYSTSPRLSPDGATILYTAFNTTPPTLYRMGFNGSNKASLGLRTYNPIVWSPRGDRILAFDANLTYWGAANPDGTNWTAIKPASGFYSGLAWYYEGHGDLPVANATVFARLVGPDGHVADAWVPSTDAAGRFQVNMTLPADAPGGLYELECVYSHWRSSRYIYYPGTAPPAFGGPIAFNASEDTPLDVDFAAYSSDPDDSVLNWTVTVTSPYAVRLNATAWRFTFPEGVLTHNATAQISDGLANNSTAVVFVIAAVNDRPVFTPPAQYNITEDVETLIDLEPYMSDPDNPTPLLVLASADPAVRVTGHVVRVSWGEGSAMRDVLLSVFDGALYANASVRFAFLPVPDPPTIDPLPTLVCTATVSCSFDLRPYVHDPDTAFASLSVGEDSPVLNLSAGILTGVYPANRTGESVNLTVSDSNATARAVLSVSVVGSPPFFELLGTLQCTEGQPCAMDLRLSLHDNDTPNGALVLTENSSFGRIVGTTFEAMYPEGELGEAVLITAFDGETLASAVLLVAVTPLNDPPLVVGEPPKSAAVGANYSFAFGATDPDDTGGFSFSLVRGPDGMALDPAGQLHWSPRPGDQGNHTFVVRVTDSHGASSERSMGVMVPNRVPVVASLSPLGATNHLPYSGKLEAQDGDGDSLQYEIVGTPPAGFQLDSRTGKAVWAPDYPFIAAGHNITEPVIVRVFDGIDWSKPFLCVLQVEEGRNALPGWRQIPSASGVVGTSEKVVLSLYANDTDAEDAGHLNFSLLGVSATVVAAELAGSVLTIHFVAPGNATVTVGVTDRSGMVVQASVAVHSQALPSPAEQKPILDSQLLLFLALLLGGIAVMVLLRRRPPVREKEAPASSPCPRCKDEVPHGSRFCSNCGEGQGDSAGTQIFR
jgi:hypothetical protein